MALHSTQRLAQFLDDFASSWELIVVDDGGGDLGAGPWSESGPIRLIRLPRNRGKGAAVREGMRRARGAVRLFTDVDLPYDLDLILLMVSYVSARGFHVVVGDRTLPGSHYVAELSRQRAFSSRIFAGLVRTLIGGGLFDTQCGLKAFRGDVAEELFRVSRIDRFAFDVELLHIALANRLDIKRIPVRLRRSAPSSVRLIDDSLHMLRDLVRVRAHAARRLYRSNKLQGIVSRELCLERERSMLGHLDFRRVSLQAVAAHSE